MKKRSKQFQKMIETHTESNMQDSDNNYVAPKVKSPKFFENEPSSHTVFLEQSTILED
jgi:hypothetical protein